MAVIVFDVNETMLDLGVLAPRFDAVAGPRGPDVSAAWFGRLLHLSTVMTTLGGWQDFGVLARDALQRTFERAGIAVDDEDVGDMIATMRRLPAHHDVVEAIGLLRDAGWATAALTNSSQAMAEEQLGHAGLDQHLDAVLSVEPTLSFKPAGEVYAFAQQQLGADPADIVLVAAHDWDCAGAMRAGWRAGFVRRGGARYSRVLQPPTWHAEDMVTLARAILA